MSAAEETSSVAHWTAELARKLSAQRARMRSAVDAQRERVRELELAFEQRFAALRSNIELAAQEAEQRDALQAAKLAELKREEDRQHHRNTELAKRRGELEALQASLEDTHRTAAHRELGLLEEVSRQLAELRQRETALAKLKNEVAATQREAEALKCVSEERQQYLREAELEQQSREESLRQLEAALFQKQLELETRQERTRRQRTSLARDLRTRRQQLQVEMEQRQRWNAAPISPEPRTASESPGEQESALQAEKAKLTLRLAELQAQLMVAQNQFQAEHHARVEAEAEAQDLRARAELQSQLAPLDCLPTAEEIAAPDVADLRNRLEMALEELRTEKKRNAELREQAAKAPAAAKTPAVANAGLDWETRKQNLLAQLEADYSDARPQEKADKLAMQRVIEETNDVLARKEAELQALRQELAEHKQQAARPHPNAGLADLLDKDERILQERENLRALQEKVRDQFKQAEVEISLERARLARERQEMEEKIQRLERQKNSAPPTAKPTQPTAPEKSAPPAAQGSRWFARLGLKDGEK